MTSPLVSVIIPLFNHEKYIVETLNSVLAQAYDSIEILLLDDESTDDSVSLARQWLKNHGDQFCGCQLIQQENSGVTKTLNRLIDLAKGQYIVPIASDDTLTPDGIEVRVNYLESHPEMLAVIGDCHVIDEHSQQQISSALFEYRTLSRQAMSSPEALPRELCIKWELPGPIVMVRATAYKDSVIGRYNESISLEDRDFYLKLLARNALGYVDVVVANYRVHGLNVSQVSHSNKKLRSRHLRDIVKIEKAHCNQFTGLAKTGILLRSMVANQKLKILDSGSLFSKVTLAFLLALLGVTYYLHRFHSKLAYSR